MIRLESITEENWKEASRLSVHEEQRGFLDTPTGIIARGYVYRDSNARVFAIVSDSVIVGLALFRNLDEAPACYDLQQLMIDRRHQGRGFAAQALRLIIAMLREEGEYSCIEVCIHNNNAPALRLFQNAGFRDTGYTDGSAPDCLNLTYDFDAD